MIFHAKVGKGGTKTFKFLPERSAETVKMRMLGENTGSSGDIYYFVLVAGSSPGPAT